MHIFREPQSWNVSTGTSRSPGPEHAWYKWLNGSRNSETFIPKLLLRLLWFFRRTAALFRQIRTFPQLFRFCSDLGNSAIRQIVRNSMLTGRWWEGRILINLCGNINVRNCDLLQSHFSARCRTVLRVTKGFFRRVWWNLEKLQLQAAVVIPLNPEGMGIGEWVTLLSENFEGMGMWMGMDMGNSKKLRNFFFWNR